MSWSTRAIVLLTFGSWLLWLAGVGLGQRGPQSSESRLSEGMRLEAAGELGLARDVYTRAISHSPEDYRGWLLRAQVAFRLGNNEGAVSDFDRVVVLAPERRPYLWQRGISQYYAGDFDGCAQQFVVHRTVNPNDVENAVWHFLCESRLHGVDEARVGLLPVGQDQRTPMREIYAMFSGAAEPAAVMEAAKADRTSRSELAHFYAELYVGLYLEANGQTRSAHAYLERASGSEVGGYMRDVARMHLVTPEPRRR